jgi:RNA polymerase subunit RPABC4/transcription elongation factor Spt4
MKCKECSHEISDNAKFCPGCGKPALSGINKIKCGKCDYEMDGNLKFCSECGEPVRSDYKQREDRRDDRRKDDDDDEGGILGGIGDFVGKLFG